MAVLVLHGGPERGTARCRWWLPQVLRCRLLAVAVAVRSCRLGKPYTAVYRLQYAHTGWNRDGRDAIADAGWALAQLSRLHPGARVALLGHSMGGRVAARLAAQPDVLGVVGLAPWLPAEDPVDHLRGVPFAVIQGTRDRELPASTTADFMAGAQAAGARISVLSVPGGGHAMLFRMRLWHRLASDQLLAMPGRT